jgi:ribosome recycling factor
MKIRNINRAIKSHQKAIEELNRMSEKASKMCEDTLNKINHQICICIERLTENKK